MLHRSASSNRVRYFRPTLENLEDRIVPASILDNPIVQQLLQPVINGAINAASGAVTNEAAGEFWILQVNSALSAFNSAPNVSNFSQLAYDTAQLMNTAILSDVFTEELGEDYALYTNLGGSPTFFQQLGANVTLSGLQTEANRLMQAAGTALGDLVAAFVALGTGGHTSGPTIPTSPPATTGGYAIDYADAPGASSENGAGVTDSVRASQSPDSNGPLQLEIKYMCTDGTTGDTGVALIKPGTSQTVSLNIMACPAGNVGTFTVYVDGQVVHQNQTSWTQ